MKPVAPVTNTRMVVLLSAFLLTPVRRARSASQIRTSAVSRDLSLDISRLVRHLPAAAERLVEVHDREELIGLGLGKGIFRRIQLLFRIQNLDVVRKTDLVPVE